MAPTLDGNPLTMNREVELIEALTCDLPHRPDTVLGSGDDCAIVKSSPDRDLLLKTDAMVEGIHFTAQEDPVKVGHKAIKRLLSDVAAMGGEAGSVLVTIGLPRDFQMDWLQSFYKGMKEVALRHHLALVGGETTHTSGPFFCSIAMTGLVSPGKAVLRSGARVRDAIFVSGTLGGSLAGKHLDFDPRLKESQWLTKHFEIHAMMDLSDGLASDLRQLCHASQVGAEIWADYLPVSRDARLRARSGKTSKPPLAAALSDGEDFELLWTLDRSQAVALKDAWKEAFPDTPLSCIGKVIEQPEIYLKDDQGLRILPHHGYDHLQQS